MSGRERKEGPDVLSDIEIAQATKPQHISAIAEKAGVPESYLELYGTNKAKVDYNLLTDEEHAPGKLILVTAINPTPAGEGKTTTTVGLADALARQGKNVVVALREPSLGPVFGVKGGAAGGGYAQVIPMEDINLHFTGDFHAIGAANNLLAAMLDNHIQQGNELGIDVRKITWKRVVDMNDRQLRNVVDGMGGKAHGVPREDGFDITVASEIMAIFCLSTSITDLKERLARIVVGYTRDDKPVTAGDLKAQGAMAALLKDALKPNLVQTLEGTPAFVHGGPFANIAHGCNSIMATRMAMALGDYCVTEAGFGADLGAEKFLDIKCRLAGLNPDAVVVVATVRALKNHGGVAKADLNDENLEALEAGLPNLLQHVENITKVYQLPCVVAINRFPTDTEAELKLVEDKCRELGVNVALSEVWAKRAAWPWPTKWCACAKSRTTSSSPTATTCRWPRRSRPSPRACTMPTVWTSSRRPWPSSRSSRTWASAACRCAWRRRSTASRTIRRSWARRAASASRCATRRCRPAPASWWR